jgi:hypothetical protein
LWKYEVDMLKIIIIIIGYILNKFHYSHHNILGDDWKYIYFFQNLKINSFFGKYIIIIIIIIIIIRFVNVETDPSVKLTSIMIQ